MSKMTAKEYLETKNRMCNKSGDGCYGCPFDQNEMGLCDDSEEKSPDEAIAIVQKWGEEHPVTTIKDKLFEVFPNTQKYSSGLPQGICPDKLGYKKGHCGSIVEDCVECWSQPYIEKK